jgi:hypothetical protein
MKALTTSQAKELASLQEMKDEDIDLSEIPGKFYRSPEQFPRQADLVPTMRSYAA